MSLTYQLETASGIPGSGPALLLVLGVTPWLARGVPERLRALALAGIITAVVQLTLAFTTPNRLEVGDIWAKSGRYAYLTIVFLLPAIALCLGLLVRAMLEYRVVAAGFAALLLAVYTVNSVGLERQYYLGERVFAQYWPQRMVSIVDAVDDGQKILTTKPANFLDKGMDPHLVVKPRIRDALPKVTPTAKGRLDAEVNYFVGVGPHTFGLFNPGRITPVFGFPPTIKQGPGCQGLHSDFDRPAVALQSVQGVELGVTSKSTEVTTQIVRHGRKSAVRVWKVKPGEVHIATSAKDATFVVGFNHGGDYIICKK
jgi:hypothetical protein